ncbi:Protein of unknown function [Pyronema omphalodes CBS 100304]|uniref:Uncharacterized protein n=1 Tax=Pyronema omphalodes (strain CBS 100304) TaxID=1076935 RepID=U4KYI1_PYROM|nr:Protein of unknown function [Pyronema omphalodes CBS 100304]
MKFIPYTAAFIVFLSAGVIAAPTASPAIEESAKCPQLMYQCYKRCCGIRLHCYSGSDGKGFCSR